MAFTRIGYGQVEPNQLTGIKSGELYASLPLDPEVNTLQQGEFMFYNYAKGMVTSDGTDAPEEPLMVYQEIKIYEDWLSYKDFAMMRVGDNYVTNRPAIGNLTSANANGTVYGDGALNKGVNPSVTYNDPASTTQPPATKTLNGHVEYGYRMDGIAPRMLRVHVGNIWTTNMVALTDNAGQVVDYAKNDHLKLKVSANNTLELYCPAKDAQATPVSNFECVVTKVYTMPDGQPGLKVQRIK